MSDRGQTVYDFLLGVVLFLVVVLSVFAVFPEIFQPFFDPSPADREEMADRVSEDILENTSTPDAEREIRYEQLNDTLQTVDADDSRVKARAGVPEFRNVHIRIQNSTQDVMQIGGRRAVWGNEPQAVWSTTVRNIRLVDVDECDSACQLVVRVW